ncbi:MAG: hypothetical protein F4171_06975 [Gammaproteobacteria bacterium]|nr:hypothetical protein [Gammaproteobacteria bacterium]MYF10362.1 hypothetical protein [Gammaproteobacteria bacterium]MYG12526.1 hypothetical protein [Gammaproteobacteria bacterium]MYH16427.1 hypothetical protein [Gammaproteobacteria bacterium]MYK29941.1 hypothetical protein [Gammaproteobacteria bacterium]
MDTSHDSSASSSVNWPRTLAAWSGTLAIALIVAMVIDHGGGLLPNLAESLVVGPVILVATGVMVVTHLFLHRIDCTRLRHYVLGYFVVILPMLLNTLFDDEAPSTLWTLGASTVLSPVLFVFWLLYFRVFFRHRDQSIQSSSVVHPETGLWSRDAIVSSFLSIIGTALIIFVLCFVFREMLRIVVPFSLRHPVEVWNGGLAFLVVVVWGTLSHYCLVQLGQTSLFNYTLAFGVFSIAFASLDVGVYVATRAVLLLSIHSQGADTFLSGAIGTVAGGLSRLVNICLFPALVMVAGPVLWRLTNRSLSRCRPNMKT